MSIEHKKETTITDGYFDRINPDILKKIPSDAGTVLEIGCGAGALASEYRKINPLCTYYGIDLSQAATAFARENNRIDHVFTADVETTSLADLGIAERSLDCIIYGDVLEHMLNPWEQLSRHKTFLKPEGCIITSIPNIGNFSIIYSLLKGNWAYQDEGLLDRTHLRFFTLSSIREMFRQAGMAIVDLEGRCYSLESHAFFMNCIKPVLPAMGLRAEAVAEVTKVFQYIVVGKPAI